MSIRDRVLSGVCVRKAGPFTQMAPYEALYGRPCRSPIFWMKVGEKSITGSDLVRDTSEKVDLIRKSILTAQSQQKRYPDKRC